MTDRETVDLDLSAMTASLHSAKSNFEQVMFQDVAETYVVDNDLRLSYVLGEKFEANSRDWVGLYQVGWRSTDNYKCFEWSSMPANYVVGKESKSFVVFPASKLPKDDGEFYQFCYVTSKGHVRGASTPFQFRKVVNKPSSIDDLIEIEDENGELLIVKSKTAYLDEQLKKANEKCCQLKQDIQLLDAEKDLIVLGKQELSKQVTGLTEEIGEYKHQLSTANKHTAKLRNEVSSLRVNVSVLSDRIEELGLEKVDADRNLAEARNFIEELKKTNRLLLNDKDSLNGRIKSLEDEKALYQKNFLSSESAVQTQLRHVEELHEEMKTLQVANQKLNFQLEELQTKLQQQTVIMEEMNAERSRTQEMMVLLEAQLSKTTIDLADKENREIEMKDEIYAAVEARQKLSADLEKEKSETEVLKSQVEHIKHELVSERESHEGLIADITRLLTDTTKEKQKLVEEMSALRRQLEEAASYIGADAALYALQSAQESLKDRFRQLEKHAELQQSLKDQSTVKIRELKEELSRHQNEIRDLKARLLMGQEEYKAKFVEVLCLQDALKKMKKNDDNHSVVGSTVTKTDAVDLCDHHSKVSRLNESFSVASVSVASVENASVKLEDEQNSVTDTILFSPKDAVRMPQAEVLALPLTPLPVPLVPHKIYPELSQVNEIVMLAASAATVTDSRPDWIAVEDQQSLPSDPGFIVINSSCTHSSCGNLTVCPIAECGLQFPANTSEEYITAHVDMHFVGEVCPVCNERFPRDSKDYAPHVQSHFPVDH